ncbi:MAG: hypothetical protein IPL52_09450 [Flavobacteriales bacterium]|nr:hypothetical protein [Flavobacteriales bacterium]
MRYRITLLIAAFGLSTLAAFAQPSDAQILKDIASPKQLKVELSKSATKKVWSSTHSQWFWERWATIWLPADIPEFPNAKVVVYGFARYHTGVPVTYREWKTNSNSYEGIPTPNNEEIAAHVRGHLKDFLGEYNCNRIVGEIRGLRVADEPKTEWHEPKSFSMNLQYEADFITSNTTVITQTKIVETRFYRDEVTGPWKSNMITQEQSSVDGAVKTYTAEDLRALPTLGSIDAERSAASDLAALGDVTIPEFSRDVDVFLYTHKLLRESTPEQFEAYLMRMLAPVYFVEGSTTRLTPQGAELINKAVNAAFKGKSTYAEQYCSDPQVKHQQENGIELWNATQDAHVRMAVTKAGGGWKNGQKVGETYKFTSLEVWMLTSADDIARIKSYEPGMLCTGSGPGLTGGGVSTDGGKANPSQQGSSGGELIKKGQGLLHKLSVP